MPEKRKNIVAVIGASQCSVQEANWAEEVGRELAKQGAMVVCGGLSGVMEAVCRGASLAGGITVGILPGDNAEAANPYVQVPVVTGTWVTPAMSSSPNRHMRLSLSAAATAH